MPKSSHPVTQGDNPRLYQTIARQLATKIEEHAADPTWRVPSERELAEELGVSRPVVREAVIALEMKGIVEVRGRAGITILRRKSIRSALETALDLSEIDAGPGPFELLEARMAIESSAAGLAAERATRYDELELEDCIAQMEQETDVLLLHEQGDRNFHMTIARMTGNSVIVSMVEALWQQRDQSPMWRKLHEHIYPASVRPLWVGDHHAILAAIRMRNREAAYNAMSRHLRNVINELLEADERGRLYTGETDRKVR